MLDERKGTAKCEPRMLLSAFPKKMPLSGKECGKTVKIYYLNGQNVAQTLRVYRRNHRLRQGPCTVKAVRDLIHKFEEIGYTCDRPRSGRPSIPVETVAEIHQIISTVRTASACSVLHVLYLTNSTVRKILCSVLNMFPFQFQGVQILEAIDNQLRLDFANKFLICYVEDGSWPSRILWTDEVHFTLTGNLNSKNCVHRLDNNPHNVFASP